MQKHLTYIVCLLLVFLASCAKARKPDYVIGVSQCSDDLWRRTMNDEMLREASFYQDMELTIRTVKDDTGQQIRDIEALINEGVDLLVISPNESRAITPVVQRAFRAGIPVILVDRKIDTDDYTAYVGADNYQIGREAGIYSAGMLKGQGGVVEMRGWNGSTSDTERHAGFMEGLKNYPGVKIIAQGRGDFLRDEAERQMSAIIQTTESIDLVFAMNDQMALGVHSAFAKAGADIPFIVGIDALPGNGGGIESIQQDLINASFIYPTGGDKVIELAEKILNNEPFDREVTLHTTVVDNNNVRVLQLQTEQIVEQQARLERMNNQLNKSMMQYSNQQMLFYGTTLVLVLISILLLVLFWAYNNKSRSNRLLEEQKNQLISLSTQLEEATQAKLVFFTNISHEFRTPLSLIIGPVDSLMASDNLTKEQIQLLDLMKRNSNRLLALISQVLEFRSFENEKMTASFTLDDVKRFLEDLNPSFADYARRKDVDFSFQYSYDTYDMWFDKDKIEKIYFNLLSNAFKYTTKGGQIKVSLKKETRNDKDFLILQIFNTGKTIPKDEINNIFNRFYKVDNRDSGTGIGLALTSALVEVHNGHIAVESIENAGTTFTVELPFEQYAKGQEAADGYIAGYVQNQFATLSWEEPPLIHFDNLSENTKPIILLIEDNQDLRIFMRLFLQEEYLVIEAEDGAKGIEKTIKYVPDIVVCDVIMPEKDGFEVCKVLRSNILTSHIPIIMLTACSSDEQKVIGFEQGVDAYIAKPFNPYLLQVRIRKLIENRQKLKETFSTGYVREEKKTTLAETEQAFIDRFRQYVIDHIADSELSVEQMAQHLHLSRVQLYRKVKSLTDYSPNELATIIKLKYAVDLLVSQRKTVSEVAYEIGFSSSSYFSKIFRKYYKENPTDFVKSVTNKQS